MQERNGKAGKPDDVRWARATILALALVISSGAMAEPWPPLPPPRPSEPVAAPVIPPSPPQKAADEPNSPSPTVTAEPTGNECLARMKTAGFDVEPATTPETTNENCRIDNPVKIRGIPVIGRAARPIRLSGEPIVACRFAEAFGDWLRVLVAPAVLGSGGNELTAVHTGPGFQCRNVNRLPSGKLSAHAAGLAVDIASFELANQTRISVKPNGNEEHLALVNAVRRAACGWFTTVLGPGADASHADHLHVDLQLHGSSDRYRICQ